MSQPTAIAAEAARPLTATERALWLFEQLTPDAGVLNIAFAFESEAGFQTEAVRAALNLLSRRHPALRQVYPATDGAGECVLLSADDPRSQAPLEVFESTEARLEAELVSYAGRPFDCSRAVPIRVGLFSTEAGNVLCFVLSHLACDAYSLAILHREFLRLYPALAAAAPVPADLASVVDPPPPAAPDPRSIQYWQDQLAGAEQGQRSLLIGRPGQRAADFPGDSIVQPLSAAATAALGELTRSLSAGPNVVALTAFACLLARHGMGEDVVIGVPVLARGSRPHAAVGLYASFIALRVLVDPRRGFAELVRACHETFLTAMLHASVSVDDVFPGSYQENGARPALFRHMFNSTGQLFDQAADTDPDALPVTRRRVPSGHSRLDLEFGFGQRGDGFEIGAIYATDMFEQAEILALLARYDQLIRSCAARPDLPVGDLPLWTEHDRMVLRHVNGGLLEPTERTADQEILARCRQSPDMLAVSQGEVSCTRGDLARVVTRGAGTLRDHGVRPGCVLAVPVTADLRFITAILSAWAAGATVLLIEGGAGLSPSVEQMAQAGARLLPGLAELAEPPEAGLALADSAPSASELDDTALLVPVPAEETGPRLAREGVPAEPSAVLARVSHRALAVVAADLRTRLGVGESDTVAWLAQPSGDQFPIEALLALCAGARLAITQSQAGDDPGDALVAVRAGATIIFVPPIGLARLLNGSAGQPLPAELRVLARGTGPLAALADQVRAADLAVTWMADVPGTAGPTLVARVASSKVSWLPAAGLVASVAGEAGQDLPPGMRGCLRLAGQAVADGYVSQPGPAAWQFGADRSGSPVLRTPVPASWLMDGTLRLHGNATGLAIGALEAALFSHPQVAWVEVSTGDDGFVCGIETRTPPNPELVSALAALLPDEAGDVRLVVTERLPTRADGTVDLVAMRGIGPSGPAQAAGRAGSAPEMPVEPVRRQRSAEPSRPPDEAMATLVEDLIELWRSVLGRRAIGPDDNFFRNGGDSMMAAQVVAQIRRRHHVRVSLRTVLREPTPARLAVRVSELMTSAGASG